MGSGTRRLPHGLHPPGHRRVRLRRRPLLRIHARGRADPGAPGGERGAAGRLRGPVGGAAARCRRAGSDPGRLSPGRLRAREGALGARGRGGLAAQPRVLRRPEPGLRVCAAARAATVLRRTTTADHRAHAADPGDARRGAPQPVGHPSSVLHAGDRVTGACRAGCRAGRARPRAASEPTISGSAQGGDTGGAERADRLPRMAARRTGASTTSRCCPTTRRPC